MDFNEKHDIATRLADNHCVDKDLVLIKSINPNHPFLSYYMPRESIDYEIIIFLLDYFTEDAILKNRKGKIATPSIPSIDKEIEDTEVELNPIPLSEKKNSLKNKSIKILNGLNSLIKK